MQTDPKYKDWDEYLEWERAIRWALRTFAVTHEDREESEQQIARVRAAHAHLLKGQDDAH